MLFLFLLSVVVRASPLPHHGPPHAGARTETLVGDDVDVGNIQMVRLGEDSEAPMYFSSEERRPGGYNYYHRLYNTDGSHFQSSEDSGSGSDYPSHHIMNNKRDQFSGQPDVNQFYHFDQHQQPQQQQHQQQYQGYNDDNSQYYTGEKEEYNDGDLSIYYSKLEDDSPDGEGTSYYSRRDHEDLSQHNENHVSVPSYEDHDGDRTTYYSRRDQENLPQYIENHVVPSYEESFSNAQIEYADIDLSDDYDDFGMEIEFERQLNRIGDGAGLVYTGDNLGGRDNAKVYVSSGFSNARESGSENVDFVYDLDFNSY